MKIDFIEEYEKPKVICPKDRKESANKHCEMCQFFMMYREENKGIICLWSKQSENIKRFGCSEML